jgi:hypothetical protein
VLHVGLVEGCEKPIITGISEGSVLHVVIYMGILSLFPEIFALGICIGLVCLSSLELLNRNSSESRVYFLELDMLRLLILFL